MFSIREAATYLHLTIDEAIEEIRCKRLKARYRVGATWPIYKLRESDMNNWLIQQSAVTPFQSSSNETGSLGDSNENR